MGDRRLKVLEIAIEVGISYSSVLNSLHERLGLSNVCARWVQRLLTPRSRFVSKHAPSSWLPMLPIQTTFYPKLQLVMKRGSTNAILTTNRSQCIGSTSTLSNQGSFALNRRQENHGHNFLRLQRCSAGLLPSTDDLYAWNILRRRF